MERSASETCNILQANYELFSIDFVINGRKNIHFWSCSISDSFIGIRELYLEKGLLTFYFGFEIEKMIPLYS